MLRERFLVALANSPILAARHRPFRIEPLARDDATASFRITYTLEDAAPAAAIIRLHREQSYCDLRLTTWRIASITRDDTS